jgi:hypothetical protein
LLDETSAEEDERRLQEVMMARRQARLSADGSLAYRLAATRLRSLFACRDPLKPTPAALF